MTYDQVDKWIEKYIEVWRSNDVSKLADLFSAKAKYKETPWGDTIEGLADIQKFWEEVCSNQGEVEARSEIAGIKDKTAEVHLGVLYKNDKPSKWRDIWVLVFNDEGLCESYQGWPWPQNQQVD